MTTNKIEWDKYKNETNYTYGYYEGWVTDNKENLIHFKVNGIMEYADFIW